VAQIRRCDALISVDTATVHIAAGLQKPLLGLYNPDMTNFVDWGPNNPQAVCVFSHAPAPYDINALDWSELETGLSRLSRMLPKPVS
jgi:ADP-heptose:LPS heptosyltransferase